MAITTTPPPAPEPAPADRRGERRRRMSVRFQLLLVAVNVAFWGAILGWTVLYSADAYDPPDLLDDTELAADMQARCAVSTAAIDDLDLPLIADTPVQRADAIDAENVVLRAMVDDLDALPRPAGEQAGWVTSWVGDWRTHIDDRQRWADRVRVGDDGPYIESVRGTEQVSEVVDGFAETNQMPDCMTVGDV